MSGAMGAPGAGVRRGPGGRTAAELEGPVPQGRGVGAPKPFGPQRGRQAPDASTNRNERLKKRKKKTIRPYKSPYGCVPKGRPVPPPLSSPPFIPLESPTPPEGKMEASTSDMPEMSPEEAMLEVLTAGWDLSKLGIDSAPVSASTQYHNFNFERSGYGKTFQGMLPDTAAVRATVTDDYDTCEEWADSFLRRDLRVLGCQLFHGFLDKPLPPPPPGMRPKKKFRKENALELPATLPPEGPLKLREGGSVIALLCLATMDEVLIVQLRQMAAIGPKFRMLLENPFVRKAGHHFGMNQQVLRQDGVQVISGDEVIQVVLEKVQPKHVRRKVQEVLQRAGFEKLAKSVAGVDVQPPTGVMAYMWGEKELTVEMVEFAARKAWTCFVMATLLNNVKSEELPLIGGIGSATPATDPEINRIAQQSLKLGAQGSGVAGGA
eukprot:evm.model.scf_998EXC.1 EVM.evm.TU.scf_998EXC.1   scf_998EXC:23031-27022(-)